METDPSLGRNINKSFANRFFRLVAFLGAALSIWYLLTQPVSEIDYLPVVLLGITIALLSAFSTPLNYLSHAAVLGGSMLYPPQTIVVAVLTGVLLACLYRQAELRKGAVLQGYFVEVGLLLVPMALAIESMNWETDVLFNYHIGGRIYRSGGTFLVFFGLSHAVFKLGDLLWQGEDPDGMSFKEGVGWVWSELAPAALVYLALWHLAYSEASALVLLGFFPLAITLLLYALTRNAMQEIPQLGGEDTGDEV